MIDRQRALDLAAGLEPAASNIARVSSLTNPDSAAWAFTQWRLRKKAEAKFAKASQMLFVSEALEQATHEAVAAYHASRFPSGVLVADLTCGIAGDLIALAQRGPATGYELDGERAECARHNISVHGFVAEVREEDSLNAEIHEYAIADPARRVGGKRTLELNEFEPNPFLLAERLRSAKLACMKLSPMLSDQALESLSSSIEFVSYGRECREALLWFGSEAKEGRWSVHVEYGERLPESLSPAPVEKPDTYFYEVDPAAIRAHCLGTLCEMHRLALVGESNGYLTGPKLVESAWLVPFEVVHPCLNNEKAVRSWLKQNNARLVSIKTRGVHVDPKSLAKRFESDGDRRVELSIYPTKSNYVYTILKRL